MKNVFLKTAIIILALTTVFFWHRSNTLSRKLELITTRIEETRKVIEAGKASKARKAGKPEIQPAVVADKPKHTAKVAIVLDDWGYNVRNVESALKIDAPITFSILPNLPYSARIANAVFEDGKEVVLHLPIEPRESGPLEKKTIMTGMSEDTIDEILVSSIKTVPNLKGISNHMGSKGTEDKRVMAAIFKRMKKERLYFLDSLVTSDSVCREVSGAAGIKFAARSIFLDNELDPDYIRGQFHKLAKQALATGAALGVGHDRAPTIAVLSEIVKEYEEMGIEIVPASSLAR